MAKQDDPPEFLTVQRHIADIKSRIMPADLTDFSSELLQAGLIIDAAHGDAIAITGLGPRQKIASLITEAMEMIRTKPDLFNRFADILERRDEQFASNLRSECHDSRPALPTATRFVAVDDLETPLFELTPKFKEDNQPLRPPSRDDSKRQAVMEFAANKVHLVIQTCNDAEYYAALEKLKPPQIMIKNQEFTKPVKYPHSELRIVVGTFADIDAAVIKTEQGAECKTDLETAFCVCKSAELLLGLGVCYGLKKNFAKHDLKFADVLVGKEIDAVLTPKFKCNGTMDLRGKVKETPKSVQMLFCNDADMWHDFIVCKEPSLRIARAFIGRLASGSFLINDPGVKQGLEEPALRYLGGEMEGWAQIEYAPERVECIIIKGIADFADGTKDKVWQLTAAMAAVDYAHYKLKQNY